MKLSIITVNYQKPQVTLACIETVYKEYKDLFDAQEIEIVVVDNASQDGSAEEIKKTVAKEKYKNIQVFDAVHNKGFGAGNNFGAKKAQGEYLLFLNNDTKVEDAGLWKMVLYLDAHKDIGILGGQLRNSDKTLQASAGSFYSLPRVILLLLGFQRFGLDSSPKKIDKVDWVKGGLFLIRKNLFEKLNGFDEHIFMYTEDMELCFRAKKMGYNSYFYPDVMVLHEEHGSASRSFAIIYIYQSLVYFYKKHKSHWQVFLVQLLLRIKAYILIVLGKLIGNKYLVKTYEQALTMV